MSKPKMWTPSDSIVEAFWERVNAVWPTQLAAVPDGVPTIPSFEQRGAEYRATLTFFYPKSSTTAYFSFSYSTGQWTCVNFPGD